MRRQRRKRSRRLAMALLAMAAPFLSSGCAGGGSSQPREFYSAVSHGGGRGATYFACNDPEYDDRGSGSYLYPLEYENRAGFFDMNRFEVVDGGKNVIFRIGLRRPIPRTLRDGSQEAKGWARHLIDIYVDKDRVPGSGYTRSLPGRNVTFTDESAWETCILVTPQRSYDVEKTIENRTSDLDLVRIRKRIIVPHRAYVEGYSFRVIVPKAEIGTPKPHWGYQVLVMPFDGRNLAYGNLYNGKVQRFADETHFGGGSDEAGNPNVIDILVPTAKEQYDLLSRYTSSTFVGENRYAKIPCIYAPAHRPVPRPAPRASRKARPTRAPRPLRTAPRRAASPVLPANTVPAPPASSAGGLMTGIPSRYQLPLPAAPASAAALPKPSVRAPLPVPASAPAKKQDGLETHTFDFKF